MGIADSSPVENGCSYINEEKNLQMVVENLNK
jgi:hypothetical protein